MTLRLAASPFGRTLLTAVVVLHLVLALGFHLSPDEAHYALYASHLDWSYFDHPPLVGWVQWPALVLGGHDFLMRIVPMACWLLAAVGVVRLTGELYPLPAPAIAAMVLFVLSPMPHLLGLALVPDTLLLPITCAVMWACWRLCHEAALRKISLWLALGLCLGLAGLAKYTAVMLALGAALVLLMAHGKGLLALPGPWIAVVLAAVLITPVLGWNATHDWISFAYQLGHVAGAQEWRAGRVGVYLLVQLIVFGLLLLAGLVAVARMKPVHPVTGQVSEPVVPLAPLAPLSPLVFCACFGLPSLLLFAFLSGRGSALPHWTAPGWLALIPPAAAGCVALWQRHRKALIVVGVVQALTFAVLAGLMLTGGIASEKDAQAQSLPGQMLDTAPVNPFADLHGWDAAAQRGRALAKTHGVRTLAVMNWTLANRIAWYARPLPVKVVQRHFDQFDLWFGTLQPGESVVLIDWSLLSFVPPVGPRQFERCDALEQLPAQRMGRQIAHFSYMVCRNWQGPLEPPLGRAG